MKSRVLFAFAAALLCAAAASAQPPQQPTPTPAPEDGQARRSLRSRVFEIKHRDPRNLLNVLIPLGSGVGGATMSFNEEFKTITVRDYPENISVIEEAIKRLDVAEPARPGVEFHVHILVATNKPNAVAETYPDELGAVIKQLQTTINYKHYQLLTSQVLRTKEQGMRQVGVKGVSELKLRPETEASKNPIFYEFRFENIVLDAPASGVSKIQIGQFGFSMKVPLLVSTGSGALQYQDIGFNTPVNMREGEKVVVGTTSMEDKGIVVVLTGAITK